MLPLAQVQQGLRKFSAESKDGKKIDFGFEDVEYTEKQKKVA